MTSSAISRENREARGRESVPDRLSSAALSLIGVTCAVCVASNYYSQPLLVEIARDLGIPRELAGLAPTMT